MQSIAPWRAWVTTSSNLLLMADGQGDPRRLKRWWTRGAGRKRWVASPHPWTALYRQLKKHMPAAMAKRVASQWFKEVFGIWPGERKGKNPVGPG